MAKFNSAVLVTKSYLGNSQIIEASGDGFEKMCIPIDFNNTDYAELMRMLANGEIIITERTD